MSSDLVKCLPPDPSVLTLSYWGLNIAIQSNCATAVDNLRLENEPFVHQVTGDPLIIQHRITHIEYVTIECLPFSLRHVAGQSDPKLLYDAEHGELVLLASRARAVDALRALVLRLIALHYRTRHFGFFHGSAAARDGNAVAFLGEKGSGKTSFMLELVYQYDWKFVADDFLMLGVENGCPTVYSLQTSVNLDAAADASSNYAGCTTRNALLLEKWLLPRESKRRRCLPARLTTSKAVLKHIIFPTIHPLCSIPSLRRVPPPVVLQFMNFSRYPAPPLPNLILADTGLYCDTELEDVVQTCHGFLFLGGMDLHTNCEQISSIVGEDRSRDE